MTSKLLACALVIPLIVFTLVACGSNSPTATPQPAGFELLVEDLDGNPVRVSDYRGKVVVVNFWAIWCPPCRVEMPDLDAVYRQYRDRGVVILAVNVSESSADIQAFAQKLGLSLLMLRPSVTYRIEALPTTFFIDRQGQVRRRQVGAMSKSFMVQQVEALLQ